MARMIYQLPSDNVAGNGTMALTSGSENADYPIENIFDGLPQKPAKLTTKTGAFRWDFGSAQQIEIAAIIHHNLDAGLEVRLQGNATDAWGTPTLNQAFTIPAYMTDGFPFNPFLDLSGLASRSFRYWRLVVVGTNSAAIAIGDVWLGATKRSLAVNISWGLHVEDEQLGIVHATSYGVKTKFPFSVKQRRVSGDVKTTDAGKDALLTWHRACKGRHEPSLIVLDPDVNDAMLVEWSDARMTVEREFRNVNNISVAWEELSRGLVL